MTVNRRNFLKTGALGAAAFSVSASSYARILGANDRVRVGVVGFSHRFEDSLLPAFMQHARAQNMELVAVSDLWNQRRHAGVALLKERTGNKKIAECRNNDELYGRKDIDAVIISTADFQHALHCKEAVEAGRDAYVEKPFAETMEDNKVAREAVERSGKIVQIGSQRRSAGNYWAAHDFIKSGKFGDITMVEMTWNVNQPGRWRRPQEVAGIKESDTDWRRYLMNRPYEAWDPRKYLEYRLFWPYSSGIPGQWMSHQIDTVHWFSGYGHPRSVAANGQVYVWQDGRTNPDTMTAVFDYGPADSNEHGFQVVYSSRMHNAAGGVKEYYYSNGGMLNLDTNKITPEGGLTASFAEAMNMQPSLLPEMSLTEVGGGAVTSASTGGDPMTTAHVLNWMECVRSRKQPNAPVQAGYDHSVANIMTRMALQTGKRVTFDSARQEVVLG